MNDQLLQRNDTITGIEFGYYSLINIRGDVQVFAPMWRITLDEHEYLVHAIGGTVQQLS